ncbi:MAG: NAD(+) synthase, partial [Flavobacteriales bacterium]
MRNEQVIDHIVNWLRDYANKSAMNGFVVGVSGGIDSALTSTLCASTGLPTVLVEMPIHQAQSQVTRAQNHMSWLSSQFAHVECCRVDLTPVFDTFMKAQVMQAEQESLGMLTQANSRARLRMTTLYHIAGLKRCLVAG